ncbi:MAG: hypothetical protein IIA27_05425 [Gemmatimonadetes bacterium]|nr:hypothetical protein [Gemmatimonadota bacterium]
MKGTVHASVLQVPTSRDDLAIERVVVLAVHAADVGILSGPNECLQPPLAFGEIQFQGEIAATRGAAFVVCRSALRRGAGVLGLYHRERVRCRLFEGQPQLPALAPMNYREPIVAELETFPLGWTRVAWNSATVAVCSASSPVAIGFQITTRYMDGHIYLQKAIGDVGRAPSDAFGMTDQPSRRCVLQSSAVVLQVGDADCNLQFLTLPTETPAGWGSGHRLSRVPRIAGNEGLGPPPGKPEVVAG